MGGGIEFRPYHEWTSFINCSTDYFEGIYMVLINGVCPDSMISGNMEIEDDCAAMIITGPLLLVVFGKGFDWILLLKEHNSLNSCNLQFGLKQYVSTTHCTFTTNDNNILL